MCSGVGSSSCQMLVLTCGTREMAFQAAWSSGSHVPTTGSLFHSYPLFPWNPDQQRGHEYRHGAWELTSGLASACSGSQNAAPAPLPAGIYLTAVVAGGRSS